MSDKENEKASSKKVSTKKKTVRKKTSTKVKSTNKNQSKTPVEKPKLKAKKATKKTVKKSVKKTVIKKIKKSTKVKEKSKKLQEGKKEVITKEKTKIKKEPLPDKAKPQTKEDTNKIEPAILDENHPDFFTRCKEQISEKVSQLTKPDFIQSVVPNKNFFHQMKEYCTQVVDDYQKQYEMSHRARKRNELLEKLGLLTFEHFYSKTSSLPENLKIVVEEIKELEHMQNKQNKKT